jgi:hypothetical protein
LLRWIEYVSKIVLQAFLIPTLYLVEEAMSGTMMPIEILLPNTDGTDPSVRREACMSILSLKPDLEFFRDHSSTHYLQYH